MADLSATGSESLTTADGRPLKAALQAAQVRAKRRAFLLVLPLLAFILITFVWPILQMLHQSAYNPKFSANMPGIAAWFKANPVGTEPDEAAFAILTADLKAAAEAKTVAVAGERVNYELSGTRSLFTATGRNAKSLEPPYKAALIAQDAKWGDPVLWGVMRQVSSAYTLDFYLSALDLKRDVAGGIIRVEENQRVYVNLFVRTFAMSAAITLICLILGFPIAHLLAVLPMRTSNLLMILVLLPFWTSLLVRTTSWMVLLQGQGVVNNLLVWAGIVTTEGRLAMINNLTGTIVAMTHILLPFMILPLYSVMRPIPPSYVRAARSLGATSWTAFRRIYLPQTLPGIGAGGLLVFILSVGYYITPALVGGASGQLISNLIAFHVNKSNNWSLAAALATILLAAILLLYWLYDRLVGIDKLKLG
ncbi:MAG: ABC transporter permease [Paracoccaceae bacterium]|nr:ABC transporter permease [Paracoccaceae bacterium]